VDGVGGNSDLEVVVDEDIMNASPSFFELL
jgi:hypothetical protein